MNKELLKKNYSIACDAYLRAFCEKHGYDFDTHDVFWAGDQPGGIACVGDLSFGMETIITDIDEDAPEEELLRWYDYVLEASEFKLSTPNYHAWLMGCPRSSQETLDKLREMKENLINLCKQENENNKC